MAKIKAAKITPEVTSSESIITGLLGLTEESYEDTTPLTSVTPSAQKETITMTSTTQITPAIAPVAVTTAASIADPNEIGENEESFVPDADVRSEFRVTYAKCISQIKKIAEFKDGMIAMRALLEKQVTSAQKAVNSQQKTFQSRMVKALLVAQELLDAHLKLMKTSLVLDEKTEKFIRALPLKEQQPARQQIFDEQTEMMILNPRLGQTIADPRKAYLALAEDHNVLVSGRFAMYNLRDLQAFLNGAPTMESQQSRKVNRRGMQYWYQTLRNHAIIEPGENCWLLTMNGTVYNVSARTVYDLIIAGQGTEQVAPFSEAGVFPTPSDRFANYDGHCIYAKNGSFTTIEQEVVEYDAIRCAMLHWHWQVMTATVAWNKNKPETQIYQIVNEEVTIPVTGVTVVNPETGEVTIKNKILPQNYLMAYIMFTLWNLVLYKTGNTWAKRTPKDIATLLESGSRLANQHITSVEMLYVASCGTEKVKEAIRKTEQDRLDTIADRISNEYAALQARNSKPATAARPQVQSALADIAEDDGLPTDYYGEADLDLEDSNPV